MKGKFITFEGSEGSGKSTQANLIYEYLREKKVPVTFIREPGGVKISELVRKILLDVKNTKMGDGCETLLYMAARAQLVEELIEPALKEGKIVLSDRFLDSTVAYQGYGHQMDLGLIKKVGEFATQGINPDLTILFDINTKEGLARTGKNKDRIERRALTYHERVRKGYLTMATQEATRIKIIKVTKGKEEIFKQVKELVDRMLGL